MQLESADVEKVGRQASGGITNNGKFFLASSFCGCMMFMACVGYHSFLCVAGIR